MKLLSCHIENYGKIHDEDFAFDKYLTSYCEANGYGKSTLASFLKAMFYGLSTDKITDDFNDRRHFNPFSGGRFGGNLTFESDGKTYKIERYFDEKSETKDSLTVYVNGKLTVMPDNLGESIFGIDKQSFERTIFISADEIEIAPTSSIKTKLNNFIEGSNDNTNLKAVLSKLEAKSKTYKKSKQANDLISEQTQRINRLTESIKNAKVIAAGLHEKYRRQEEVTKQIRQLSEDITAAQSRNLVLKDWERYDAISAETQKAEAAAQSIEARYPYGVPSAEEISAVGDAIDAERTLKASGRQKLFSEDDALNYSALHARFSRGAPSDEQIAETEKKIEEVATLSYDVQSLSRTQTTPKEDELKQKFAHRVPAQEEVDRLDKKAEEYKKAESDYESIINSSNVSAPVQATTRPSSNKLYAVLAAVAALLAVCGAVLLFFAPLAAGIACLAVGVIALVAVGFLYLNKKTSSNAVLAQSALPDSPQRIEATKVKDGLFNEIQSSLAIYGYAMTNGVAYAVATFKEDVKSYRILLAREGESERILSEKTSRRQRLCDEIDSFFALYGVVGENYARRLANLRTDISSYASLKSRKETSATNDSRLEEKIKENRKCIVAFCEKYRFDLEVIDEKIKLIAKDCGELASARMAKAEGEGKLALFKKEKNLTKRPEGQGVELKELNERLASLQEKKNALLSEITADEYEAEKLGDLMNDLDEANEKLREYNDKYNILCKTMEALKQADGRLKDKYIKPIRDKFIYYSTLLEKALGEKIILSPDFEIRYERGGQERSEKHLSSGQRSICAFCFRLALIDNMYAVEKPFLILDDPFLSLDEVHMNSVKDMVKELSENLQIIYFSCHSSRDIN